MASAPSSRLRFENDLPLRPEGKFVVYWMIAARRPSHSHALDHSIRHAALLKKPLVILEALRCDYPYASDRLHTFITQGMADNFRAFEGKPVLYYPYVERALGDGKGLLVELSRHACVVVTDRFPAFFLPRMVSAAARRLSVRMESVDSCGLLPLAAAPKAFARAHDYRRFLDKTLAEHLTSRPKARPFQGVRLERLGRLPEEVSRRWPAATLSELSSVRLGELPLDHAVRPSPVRGGRRAGQAALRTFVSLHIGDYERGQRHPDDGVTSGLSPYLHFGHVGSHQVVDALERARDVRVLGGPSDWHRLGPSVSTFLDQLVTWRELGYVECAVRGDVSSFRSLPPWCKQTLLQHKKDERVTTYELEQLMMAETYDEVWNAAQRQLLEEGRIHNYLRMIWGKRVIEWTPDPEEAFERLVYMNDSLAIDGRDPNSYSGIAWCFGRYDRPWPTRPVYGQVRYMSSEATLRKLKMKEYMSRWGKKNRA